MSTQALLFTVPGMVAPKGSTKAFPIRRRNGQMGVTVTAANPHAKRDQGRIAWAAQLAMQQQACQPFITGVVVRLDFVLQRPRTAKNRPHPIVKPDLDKLVRLVLDGLTGVAFLDDAQVCRVEAQKRYIAISYDPYVRVEVEEV